jgi:prepilin-type N-terminal cleavage/methylation domain-containing protein
MKHNHINYMRRQAGFSMVELMVVVGAMGLLLALSVPAIRGWVRSMRLSGETNGMAMMMRTARSVAINRNADVVFVFDQSEGQYFYVIDADGDGAADDNEVQSGTHTLRDGVSIGAFTTPQQWITFTPRGSTSDGGTITVQGHSENYTRTIRVYSGTGNVTVE